MDDLIRSINSLEIEKITGESQETIKRWKKGTKKISESELKQLKRVETDKERITGLPFVYHVKW